MLKRTLNELEAIILQRILPNQRSINAYIPTKTLNFLLKGVQ
jgi:hypothetical protein